MRGATPPSGCQDLESVISLINMTKALQLAMTKAAALPEAAQEQLGRELLERIERLNELRVAIEVCTRELDAGLGEELDIEELIGAQRRTCRPKIGGSSGCLPPRTTFVTSGVILLE